MQAYEFLEAFQRIFAEDSSLRSKAEDSYCSNKKYTEFIIKSIQAILTAAGLDTQKEYFRIDAIGWKDCSDTPPSKNYHLFPHQWDLEVAVEHENSSKDWMDEVVKLAHIACPLRVVIGYLPMEKRREEGFEQAQLDFVCKILSALKCADNMARGEFLVIIGNSNTRNNKKNYFHYKGYVYNAEVQSFRALTGTA